MTRPCMRQILSAAAASVSGALDAISNDLKHKGLAVNVHKTVSMIISPASAKATCRVICNGATLPLVHEHHVLGLIIADKLSWSAHIDAVVVRAGRKVGCLRRVHRQLSLQARRLFLLSVILPILDYASSAFCMQESAKDRERFQAVFRRAICAAFGASCDAQVDPLMDQLNAHCVLDK